MTARAVRQKRRASFFVVGEGALFAAPFARGLRRADRNPPALRRRAHTRLGARAEQALHRAEQGGKRNIRDVQKRGDRQREQGDVTAHGPNRRAQSPRQGGADIAAVADQIITGELTAHRHMAQMPPRNKQQKQKDGASDIVPRTAFSHRERRARDQKHNGKQPRACADQKPQPPDHGGPEHVIAASGRRPKQGRKEE